jgi:toluene monooxygenase system protein E
MIVPGLPRKHQLKTYSHLAGARRMPTEYEVTSTRLLWYAERGFEVKTPLDAWYQRYQRESPLTVPDWERFCDPRHTTYALYTQLQSRQETFVDGLLRSIEERGYDYRLSQGAVRLLNRMLVPLRFPLHGLQLAAAYLGQMAPSGRITITAALQSADELRRVQRIAHRAALLRRAHPHVGDTAARAWQDDALWQPLRRLVEELLVTWDWGECFTALNLCVKPLFEELFLVALARVARSEGDELFGELCGSLATDGRWHSDWSAALARTAIHGREENRAVLRRWAEDWGARACTAFQPFAAELGVPSPLELSLEWLAERKTTAVEAT